MDFLTAFKIQVHRFVELKIVFGIPLIEHPFVLLIVDTNY